MARLFFIVLWMFITALLAHPLYAQNTEVLSSQPMIHGEINGMKVMAQGDAVAFMASKRYTMALDEEACARDLHCTLQKNRTEAVVLNPEGIWIFDTPPKQLPDNVNVTEPLYPVSTEVVKLSGTAIKPTPTHIPLEFPQPTATLHTGNEVVDKTPGILLVSSPVMTWLAETVTTVSHSRQAMDSDESLSPIIEPTPTQQKVMLTTITEEEDELLRKLTSTSTMPTPTPTLVENRLWEGGSIWLEIETDILTIQPSPSGQYGVSMRTNSFSFTTRQVSVSKSSDEGGKSSKDEQTTTHSDSIKSQIPQMTNLPESRSLTMETAAATGSSIDNKPKPRIIVTGIGIDPEKAKAAAEQRFHDFMTRNQLTIDDLKKLVKRCAPEKQYHHLGLTIGREPILKLLDENSFAYLSYYVEDFEEWLSIPEYTAAQKRKLLAKLRKKRDWSTHQIVLETPQETAERVAEINQMSDEEIHRKYHDWLIHEGMMIDSRQQKPASYTIWGQYVEDYTAQEKREILYRHFLLYPKTYCDESAYRFLWNQATDDYVHEQYSDDKIRALEVECKTGEQK